MESKAGRSHVVRFYGMLKIPWSPSGTDRLNSHFLRPLSYSLQRCLCWQDRQSTGGCQSALVDKLGVSPIKSYHGPHRNHTGMKNRPVRPQFWDVSLTNLPSESYKTILSETVHRNKEQKFEITTVQMAFCDNRQNILTLLLCICPLLRAISSNQTGRVSLDIHTQGQTACCSFNEAFRVHN
jgi:hypothetical protein